MSEQTPARAAEPQGQSVWVRALFMIAFLILFGIGQTVLTAAAILQFLWEAITGQSNANITLFGRSLARWLSAVVLYLLHDTDDKPFPWADWPSGPVYTTPDTE
ncbi:MULTISPECIES: DUF4389 domain-containing protein [Rhodomicrobium]|uniref:DUF4389 domain-containing protein n=1 Tax=Rhodomicrobium TaxID=1068 RepID=UPI00148343E0|nr:MULTISPECIES: DUF4389 domain-containing protein [Rhodomicrobium]